MPKIRKEPRFEPEYIDVSDAAAILNVSESLIYQLCDERRIAHTRLGGKSRRGCIRFLIEDVRKFAAENRVEAV